VNALGAGPVRDLGLLDSACHRPRASLFGQEAYPALTGKAATLKHSLAGNHALADGNKRLALLATVVFLRINSYVLDLTDDEAFALTMSVAAGQLDALLDDRGATIWGLGRGCWLSASAGRDGRGAEWRFRCSGRGWVRKAPRPDRAGQPQSG
jgi:death on curing protein